MMKLQNQPSFTKGYHRSNARSHSIYTYMSPIGDIYQKHNISFQSYADDQQNYLSFKPMGQTDTPKTQCVQKIQECIAEIRPWMHTNLLKLNDGKTEVLVVGTRQQLETTGPVTIATGEDLIEPVHSVCNLGYHMNNELKDKIHINKLTASSMGILKNISRVRHLLDMDSTKTLVQTPVMSRLDYCNSLLIGALGYQLDKLQTIQNMACRVICGKRKHDHISEDIKGLHWHKIRECITYKVACLVFKCIHNMAQDYLQDLLQIPPRRGLRSQQGNKLFVNRAKLSQVQKSCFSVVGPTI